MPGRPLHVTAGFFWPKAMAAGIRGQKADTEWPLKQFAEIKVEGCLSRHSKNRERLTAEGAGAVHPLPWGVSTPHPRVPSWHLSQLPDKSELGLSESTR